MSRENIEAYLRKSRKTNELSKVKIKVESKNRPRKRRKKVSERGENIMRERENRKLSRDGK